ncbi:hypothetical protein IFO70_31110 [Phormidium tenue FACHB-886]|nr:hypothetical protein [Phormidium tenue FACHB-886]
MPSQPSETDLWQELKTAMAMPQSANLKRLCELLDWAIAQLSEDQQLRVAGQAIEQMAEIYALRFNVLTGIWANADPSSEEALPVLDLEVLEAWIRQSMSVDLDALVEQPNSTRNRKKPIFDDTDSVVAVVESEAVLQMVEEIEAEEHSQMIQKLAGEEDPARWSAAIVQWRQTNQSKPTVRMSDLFRELKMPWVEIWLGLLLGEFDLEQTGEFYTGEVLVHFRA